LRSKLPAWLPVFGLAALTVAVDQITKFVVRAYIPLGDSLPAHGFVRLTHTTNTGGVFGLFANQGFLLTVVVILLVAVLLLYLRYSPLRHRLLKVGLGLELGGAVGNLIDRLSLGKVTDFIDVGAWPVFNLADSAITVGAVVLAAYLVLAARSRAPSEEK